MHVSRTGRGARGGHQSGKSAEIGAWGFPPYSRNAASARSSYDQLRRILRGKKRRCTPLSHLHAPSRKRVSPAGALCHLLRRTISCSGQRPSEQPRQHGERRQRRTREHPRRRGQRRQHRDDPCVARAAGPRAPHRDLGRGCAQAHVAQRLRRRAHGREAARHRRLRDRAPPGRSGPRRDRGRARGRRPRPRRRARA